MPRRIANDWAVEHIAALKRGEHVQFRPVGGSMAPLIESGQLVNVAPPSEDWCPTVDTIVLVQVRDFTYLHLIRDIQGERYLIGNNRGGLNGWVGREAIYGVIV